ncbi:MAG: hypothetical protein CMH83_08960 [Nocardioides sp.]|nr:hypothetical protein [Nocardioides sp.]
MLRGSGGLATLAVLAQTGCGTTSPAPPVTDASQAVAEAAAVDDDTLLAQLREALATARATVEAVRARHRSLRGPLRPLARLHREHAAVLDEAGADPGEPPEIRSPRRPAAARRAVEEAEQTLVTVLLATAADAASGALALLASSMAAALVQLGAVADVPDDGLGAGADDALQTVLGAEHAALFLLSYLGAQTSRSALPAVATALDEAWRTHRDRRDALEAVLRASGADPVAAEPSYALPDLTGRPARVAARAVAVERACGEAYGYLLASSVPSLRGWPTAALVDSAAREIDLGGEPRTYPGR